MRKLGALRRRTANEAGYSLIEMLVTLTILGVVMGGITTAFVSGSKGELGMNKRFQQQQSARLALSRLRTDIHVSGCTPTVTGASSVILYPAPPVSGSCTGTATIAWCTAASTAMSGRYALYRLSAATCTNVTTTGSLIADYLSTNLLFTSTWPASGSKQRETVTVTIPVQLDISTYTLADTIVLRNFPPA